jgi:hypothetical protein
MASMPLIINDNNHENNDPEIKTIRVQNRMSTAYDSSLTCGYRNVLVNLCAFRNMGCE